MTTKIDLLRPVSKDLVALKRVLGRRYGTNGMWRARLRMLESEFNSYAQNFRAPLPFGKLAKGRSTEAKVLRDLYDSKAKCMGYIDKWRDLANEVLPACPYCGTPDTLTLDHYLPRAQHLFPHFSALSANLVPACMPCQQIKSTFYPAVRSPLRLLARLRERQSNGPARKSNRPNRHGSRAGKSKSTPQRILHPFFDTIFSRRVLRLVEVDCSTGGSVFRLAATASDHYTRRLADFHVRRMELSERSASHIQRLLDSIVCTMQDRGITTEAGALSEAVILLRSERALTRKGGTLDLVVRYAFHDNPQLRAHLLQRAATETMDLILETRAIAVDF